MCAREVFLQGLVSMRVKALQGVGAEVSEIDLGRLSDSERVEIRAAFAEYGLLFFRDQDIDEQGHLCFSRMWGKINVNRFFVRPGRGRILVPQAQTFLFRSSCCQARQHSHFAI